MLAESLASRALRLASRSWIRNREALIFFSSSVTASSYRHLDHLISTDHLMGLVHKNEFKYFDKNDGSKAQSGQSAKLFSSRRNWDSPTPSPADECVPRPLVQGEGTYTLAGEGMGGLIPTRRQTLLYSRYICSLWYQV